ncbi:MAG: hypothetical protein IKR21_02060, partial [Oscillospiraceae bacterium]|nr:hypothetical protein [Oscillospiraceae bacterium]
LKTDLRSKKKTAIKEAGNCEGAGREAPSRRITRPQAHYLQALLANNFGAETLFTRKKARKPTGFRAFLHIFGVFGPGLFLYGAGTEILT